MTMIRKHGTPINFLEPNARTTALFVIHDERDRQERLKAEGKFTYTCADAGMSTGERLACVMEEVGEVATDCLALRGIVEETADEHKLYVELSQVAALCVAWMEYLHGRIVVRN